MKQAYFNIKETAQQAVKKIAAPTGNICRFHTVVSLKFNRLIKQAMQIACFFILTINVINNTHIAKH